MHSALTAARQASTRFFLLERGGRLSWPRSCAVTHPGSNHLILDSDTTRSQADEPTSYSEFPWALISPEY